MVHRPALPAELGVGAPIAPPGVGAAELAQLLPGSDPGQTRGLVALGGAVLPDQLARPPLGDAEHLLQVLDGAARRAGITSFPAQPPSRLRSGAPCRPPSASAGHSQCPVLEPLDVVGIQSAVLFSPAIVGLLRDHQSSWRPRARPGPRPAARSALGRSWCGRLLGRVGGWRTVRSTILLDRGAGLMQRHCVTPGSGHPSHLRGGLRCRPRPATSAQRADSVRQMATRSTSVRQSQLY